MILDGPRPLQRAVRRADEFDHILLVMAQGDCRRLITAQLRARHYLITLSACYGVVETLRANPGAFDLLVTAQSGDEMTLFGLPQLARSIDPVLPILVLDSDAACGCGTVDAVQDAIRRWPLRERAHPWLH